MVDHPKTSELSFEEQVEAVIARTNSIVTSCLQESLSLNDAFLGFDVGTKQEAYRRLEEQIKNPDIETPEAYKWGMRFLKLDLVEDAILLGNLVDILAKNPATPGLYEQSVETMDGFPEEIRQEYRAYLIRKVDTYTRMLKREERSIKID